jgi:hypothetical protein
MSGYGLKVAYRNFKCKNCDHVQPIQTNHEGECFNYCKKCSWMVGGSPKRNEGALREHCIPFNGRTYRPFVFAGNPGETTYGQ